MLPCEVDLAHFLSVGRSESHVHSGGQCLGGRVLLGLLPLVVLAEDRGPAWPVSHGQWGRSPRVASQAEGRAGCPRISPGTQMGRCWQGCPQMAPSVCRACLLEVLGVAAARRAPETSRVPSEWTEVTLFPSPLSSALGV